MKSNYVDGIEQGEDIWYYESGEIQAKGYVVMGKLQGEYIQYYENGQIERIRNYKDGVLIDN